MQAIFLNFLIHNILTSNLRLKNKLIKKVYLLSFIDKQVKFFLENKMIDRIITVNSTNNVDKHAKYLRLAIFQPMPSVSLISFVNFIVII